MSLPPSLVRYLMVGVLNTCVGLGTIYLAMYFLGSNDVAANGIGYLVGIVFSFLLNKYWTFAARDIVTGIGHARQFAKFLLVTGVAYAFNLATVMVLIKIFAVNRNIAQPAGVIPYTVIGYLGSRFFAFRPLAAPASLNPQPARR